MPRPGKLRDITRDLEVRLKELRSEKDELTEQIKAVEKLVAIFTATLAHERKRATEQLPLPLEAQSKGQAAGSIVRQVREILSGQQEQNLSQITEAVKNRGMNFGSKNPNRVVHFALVGMKRQGLVEIVSQGVWRAKPKLLEEVAKESKTGETPNTTS